MRLAVPETRQAARRVRERLRSYPDEVLIAAIAAEQARPDCRHVFIQLLEAELERRQKEKAT